MDGVRGMLLWPLSSSYCRSDWFCSCTAKDLTVAGGRRSREHTEALVSGFELGVLWDEYGLVGDLVVCNHLVGPFITSDCDASQPFTNDFPCADIHQLIAPDLLHQLIKGTFKDHLVSWVCKYIINTHGQARANQILDDIDKRYD
jgi:Plavaka transposase